jgi:iron complex transport system substrate-binding protein
VSAARRSQRSGRGGVPGLSRAAARLARRAATPRAAHRAAAAVLLAALGACRQAPPAESAHADPRRVVTLAPNLTEIVFALGAGDRLVGVSEHSDFPEEAERIPRIGGLEVDAEKVAALRPDLVLAISEGSARGAVRALEAAGLPVTVISSGSLDEVLAAIRVVGERLGRSAEAERLTARLSARREAVRARAGREGRRPRALLLVWPDPPQAAGRGTFLGDLLTEAGAENLAGDRAGWPVLSAEYLATAPVELLVIPDAEATRAAWGHGFASGALSRGTAAQARVVRVEESSLTRAGPRVFDALETLSDAVGAGRTP